MSSKDRLQLIEIVNNCAVSRWAIVRRRVVQALYARGAKWLQGEASPFDEPPMPSGAHAR